MAIEVEAFRNDRPGCEEGFVDLFGGLQAEAVMLIIFVEKGHNFHGTSKFALCPAFRSK